MYYLFSHSTHLLAATTLRNVLGTKHLAEILSERETISHVMEQTLDEATDPWGVKVERVEMLVTSRFHFRFSEIYQKKKNPVFIYIVTVHG